MARLGQWRQAGIAAVCACLPGRFMTLEDARRLYYESRVLLVRLIKKRDRILRGLQWDLGDTRQEGAFRLTDDSDLLRQLDELTAAIGATTKLVNQYADQIGSPRVSEQNTRLDRTWGNETREP